MLGVMKMGLSFSEIVDRIQELDSDSKKELLGLLRAWLAEDRRQEIARNAQEARGEYAQRKLKSGDIDELMADLYAED
jgi:hypothetical protein